MDLKILIDIVTFLSSDVETFPFIACTIKCIIALSLALSRVQHTRTPVITVLYKGVDGGLR